jgi:hypothetical protein
MFKSGFPGNSPDYKDFLVACRPLLIKKSSISATDSTSFIKHRMSVAPWSDKNHKMRAHSLKTYNIVK